MLTNLMTWDFWNKALGRALRTFCQTLISLVTVGQMFTDFDWVALASISGVAALMSVCTSIVREIPKDDDEKD